jgi:hypothetical protein
VVFADEIADNLDTRIVILRSTLEDERWVSERMCVDLDADDSFEHSLFAEDDGDRCQSPLAMARVSDISVRRARERKAHGV